MELAVIVVCVIIVKGCANTTYVYHICIVVFIMNVMMDYLNSDVIYRSISHYKVVKVY